MVHTLRLKPPIINTPVATARHTPICNQERSLEADSHRCTVVTASDRLFCARREVDILSRNLNAVLAQRQTELCSTVVCKHSYALAGVDDRLTIYRHDIVVTLRDNGIVVRETALDLTANDDRAAELKTSILGAEGHLHVALLFCQQVLQQTSGCASP